MPSHVLVVTTLASAERGGGRRGLRRRRGPQPAAPEPSPRAAGSWRVTLVRVEPFGSAAEADRWRAELDAEAEVAEGFGELNRVVHLHRVAVGRDAVRDLDPADALVVRVGVGEGEQVAHGLWRDAVAVPQDGDRAALRRASALRPQERLAAMLGGRDVALAAELLVLRARSDFDAGRLREAALQLRVGYEAALAELASWAGRSAVAERLDALRGERAAVGAAANAAVQGGLDEATIADVERVLRATEAALRARAVTAIDAPL